MDRRTRPDRIARVLRDIGADVIALQEVIGPGPHGHSHIEEIGAALGMGWVMAPARHVRGHQFGNVVLSRFPINGHVQHDLSWKNCWERYMQRVDIESVGPSAARLQRSSGDRYSRAPPPGPPARHDRVRSARDRSEGCPRRLQRVDAGADHDAPQRETEERGPSRSPQAASDYPGLFPFLHLDHIYYAGELEIAGVQLFRTRLSLVASDHLPLVADVRVRF